MCKYDDEDIEEIMKLIDEVFSDVESIESDTFHVFNINDFVKESKKALLN